FFPGKLRARLLAQCILVFTAVFLAATSRGSAADPLGATLHDDGTTTFRVWAPFVDAVGVKINGGAVIPLTKEPGHTDPADTTWTGTVNGTQARDKYRYAITRCAVTREFNDPQAQQLTGFDLPDGYGLPGNDDKPQSIIVDTSFNIAGFYCAYFQYHGDLRTAYRHVQSHVCRCGRETGLPEKSGHQCGGSAPDHAKSPLLRPHAGRSRLGLRSRSTLRGEVEIWHAARVQRIREAMPSAPDRRDRGRSL